LKEDGDGLSLLIVVAMAILPSTRLGEIFGFTPLLVLFHLLLGVIVVLYIVTAEIAKTIFYKKVKL
jgi:Mg2+-importing ATPase